MAHQSFHLIFSFLIFAIVANICVGTSFINPYVIESGSSLNKTCEGNSECLVQNSHCQEKVCHCLDKFVAVNSAKEETCDPGTEHLSCLPIIETTRPRFCNVDQQCQNQFGSLAKCFGDEGCGCNEDAVFVQETRKCELMAKHLGDTCTDDEQCYHIPHSECSKNQGVCVCSSRWVIGSPRDDPDPTKKQCFPVANKLGDICSESDAQCANLPNTACSINNTCECKNDRYIPNESESGCLEKSSSESTLGQECEENGQCKNSTCVYGLSPRYPGVCECPGTEVNSFNYGCLVKAGLGQSCINFLQCHAGPLGQRSTCDSVTKTCRCYDYDAIAPNGKCVLTSGPTQLCTFDEECDSPFVCRFDPTTGRRACDCPPGKVRTNTYPASCVNVTSMGSPCESTEECRTSLGSSVACNNATKICECSQGYRLSTDGKKCLRVAATGVGDKCTESSECQKSEDGEQMAICDTRTGVCKCWGNYTVSENKICEKVSPDDDNGIANFHSQKFLCVILTFILIAFNNFFFQN